MVMTEPEIKAGVRPLELPKPSDPLINRAEFNDFLRDGKAFELATTINKMRNHELKALPPEMLDSAAQLVACAKERASDVINRLKPANPAPDYDPRDADPDTVRSQIRLSEAGDTLKRLGAKDANISTCPVDSPKATPKLPPLRWER